MWSTSLCHQHTRNVFVVEGDIDAELSCLHRHVPHVQLASVEDLHVVRDGASTGRKNHHLHLSLSRVVQVNCSRVVNGVKGGLSGGVKDGVMSRVMNDVMHVVVSGVMDSVMNDVMNSVMNGVVNHVVMYRAVVCFEIVKLRHKTFEKLSFHKFYHQTVSSNQSHEYGKNSVYQLPKLWKAQSEVFKLTLKPSKKYLFNHVILPINFYFFDSKLSRNELKKLDVLLTTPSDSPDTLILEASCTTKRMGDEAMSTSPYVKSSW